MKTMKVSNVLTTVLISVAIMATASRAAPVTWSPTSGTAWSTAANWDNSGGGNAPPGFSDDAVFGTKGSTVNPNVTATISQFNGIIFNAGGWTITQSGANTLNIRGGGVNMPNADSGSVTINPIVKSNTGATWTIAAGNTVTMAARLEFGNQTINKNGDGTLVLNGNAVTGNSSVRYFNVNAGSVFINGNNFSSTTSGRLISVAAGATLGGSGQVGANGSEVVNLSVSGTISPGSTGANTGRLTMAGASTFNGGSTLSLQLNGATAVTGYDQFRTGGLTLSTSSGVSNVALDVSLGFDPASDDGPFTLVDNTSANAVTGLFKIGSTTLNEGDRFSLVNPNTGNSFDFEISYAGGTGNDVTLSLYVPSGTLVTIR